MNEVFIVDTGIANLASVEAALLRINAVPRLTQSFSEIQNAEALILPGVGSFGAGMQKIREHQLEEALIERIELGRPTFAICLGMQLLCSASEESPGISGLGIFNQTAKRFSSTLRVPHFGWNRVASKDPFFGDGYAYFANSYRLIEAPSEWEISWCEYGDRFVSGVRKGSVVATQFHPELSGQFGSDMLTSWIQEAIC